MTDSVRALALINEVVDNLESIVSRDGGRLSLREYDDLSNKVVVTFSSGENPDCAACVVDEELVHVFLLEGLQARGLAIDELTIESN